MVGAVAAADSTAAGGTITSGTSAGAGFGAGVGVPLGAVARTGDATGEAASSSMMGCMTAAVLTTGSESSGTMALRTTLGVLGGGASTITGALSGGVTTVGVVSHEAKTNDAANSTRIF